MSKNFFLAVAIVSVFTMLIIGCNSKQESPATHTQSASGDLVLENYGPQEIYAGKLFNVQPEGESAIWTYTQNATPGTILVLNGVELNRGNVEQNGTVVTALVPRELYKKAGDYPLYLLDKKSNRKSNTISFVVRP